MYIQVERRALAMVAYRFYYVDERGNRHLVGILPERRRLPGRITNHSIMKWWREVAGSNPMQKGHRIQFEQADWGN
jgi:hypothetical protein